LFFAVHRKRRSKEKQLNKCAEWMAREDDPPGFAIEIFEEKGKSEIMSNEIEIKNNNVA
jgi:hypothetical protein